MESIAARNNKIQETVREILRDCDWNQTSLKDIRKAASKKLDIDLSEPNSRKFVKEIVNSYVQEQEVEVEEHDVKNNDDDAEKDDDFLICKLKKKDRRVTATHYCGKKYLSIRDYYFKDGQYLPTRRGINLSVDDWAILMENIPAIEKAIMMPKKD